MLLSHIYLSARDWAETQRSVTRRRYLETAAIDMASVLTSKHDGMLDDANDLLANVVFGLMAAVTPNPRDAFEYSTITGTERELGESHHVLEYLLNEIAALLLREANPRDDPSFTIAYTVATIVRTILAIPWFKEESIEPYLEAQEV